MGKNPAVRHRAREQFTRRAVCHVRLRIRDDISSLRNVPTARALRTAFAKGCAKPGFSLCQFSIQATHLYLVCEADNHVALGRGMQGLAVRAAKAINQVRRRKGSVFAERYRVTRVKTPTQMRHTLCYVLHNARRHGSRFRGIDFYPIRGTRTHRAATSTASRGRMRSSSGRRIDHSGGQAQDLPSQETLALDRPHRSGRDTTGRAPAWQVALAPSRAGTAQRASLRLDASSR